MSPSVCQSIMHTCIALIAVNYVNLRQSDTSNAEGNFDGEKMLAPRLLCMTACVPTPVFEGDMGPQACAQKFGVCRKPQHTTPRRSTPDSEKNARSATGLCMTASSPTLVFERNMGAQAEAGRQNNACSYVWAFRYPQPGRWVWQLHAVPQHVGKELPRNVRLCVKQQNMRSSSPITNANVDPLGFEPRAFCMRSGCDTTTP